MTIIHTRLLWFADGLTVNQHLIIIHPRARADMALLAHEQTHQQQMRRTGTRVFWWRYLTDRQFRQRSEVEAYKVSIAHGASADVCATHLATLYWLGLTQPQAHALLKD